MSINRVILTGRLTRDPELRSTTTGKEVASMRIAVDRRFKSEGQPDADFFNVVAWGQSARYSGDYLTKGRLIAVDGRLQVRTYTTQEGQNREVVEVVTDTIQALDRPREDSGSRSESGYAAPAASAAEDEYDPFAEE